MKRRTKIFIIAASVAGSLSIYAGGAMAAGDETVINPSVGARADRILREMGEYLAEAREFRFRADITFDTSTISGQRVQYGGITHVSVRRPNRIHVKGTGDEGSDRYFYNGSTFTLFDEDRRLYAVTQVPNEIDGALDTGFETYGISVPIAGFIHAQPYRVLIANVNSGFLVGKHQVDGTPSFHLAFAQEAIDWQIWIEDGPRPVPRKLLITFKDQPGSPQYTARLSDWDFRPGLSDHLFEFHPPAGASEMEFLAPVEVEIE